MSKPILYLLCGLPGSGKTKYAKNLENESNIRFTLDEEFLLKHGQEFDNSKFSEMERKVADDILIKAEVSIKQGKNVILDFGFWKKENRKEVRERFEKIGADVKLIYFNVPKELRFERVLARDKEGNHDIDQEALEKFEKEFEVPEDENAQIVN